MKAIVCEMCSSRDVVKQDGFFVCQSCGTKYSTEDAKKLMIEVAGTVDVTGSTVSVNYTAQSKKSLENARRAMSKEDWDETEKYYDLVEQNDPSNIEAIFYSAYAKAMNTLVVEDIFRRKQVFTSFSKSISIIDDNFDVEKEAELRPIIEKMSQDMRKMFTASFVYTTTTTKNGYGNVTSQTDNKDETIALFRTANAEFATALQNIALRLPGNMKDAAVHYYKLAMNQFNIYAADNNTFFNYRFALYDQMQKIYDKVKALDPNADVIDVPAKVAELKETQKKHNRGCLIYSIIGAAVVIAAIIIIVCSFKI